MEDDRHPVALHIGLYDGLRDRAYEIQPLLSFDLYMDPREAHDVALVPETVTAPHVVSVEVPEDVHELPLAFSSFAPCASSCLLPVAHTL